MTTVTSELDARVEIRGFIDRSRAPYGQWYVGVTSDAERRLEQHAVEESDWYIVKRLADAEAAKRVAEAMLKLGCDGTAAAVPMADEDEGPAAVVYAYWKRDHTEP